MIYGAFQFTKFLQKLFRGQWNVIKPKQKIEKRIGPVTWKFVVSSSPKECGDSSVVFSWTVQNFSPSSQKFKWVTAFCFRRSEQDAVSAALFTLSRESGSLFKTFLFALELFNPVGARCNCTLNWTHRGVKLKRTNDSILFLSNWDNFFSEAILN